MAILLYFIAFSAFVFTKLVYPENFPYLISYAKPLFVFCLPGVLFFSALQDYAGLLGKLRIVSYFLLPMGIFLALTNPPGYDMWLSYYMLLPLLVLTNQLFVRFQIWDLLLALASALAIFLYGSRGAVVCWGVFLLLYLIVMLNKTRRSPEIQQRRQWRNLFLTLFAAGCLLIIGYLVMTALISKSWVDSLSSRTLKLFFTGEILTHSSGRTELIYPFVWGLIRQNPLFGLGICGDRAVYAATGLGASYPHNLFLEFLVHYGALLGGILSVLLIVVTVYTIRKKKNREELSLFLILFCSGFFPLMVSGTYLDSTLFWCYAAFCLTGFTLKLRRSLS